MHTFKCDYCDSGYWNRSDFCKNCGANNKNLKTQYDPLYINLAAYRIINIGEGFYAQRKVFGFLWYENIEHYNHYQKTKQEALDVCIWNEQTRVARQNKKPNVILQIINRRR